jgi:hypothetical protein
MRWVNGRHVGGWGGASGRLLSHAATGIIDFRAVCSPGCTAAASVLAFSDWMPHYRLPLLRSIAVDFWFGSKFARALKACCALGSDPAVASGLGGRAAMELSAAQLRR